LTVGRERWPVIGAPGPCASRLPSYPKATEKLLYPGRFFMFFSCLACSIELGPARRPLALSGLGESIAALLPVVCRFVYWQQCARIVASREAGRLVYAQAQVPRRSCGHRHGVGGLVVCGAVRGWGIVATCRGRRRSHGHTNVNADGAAASVTASACGGAPSALLCLCER
jgi:hypothetical protein